MIHVILTLHSATITYSLGWYAALTVPPSVLALPAEAFFNANPKVTNSVLCFAKGDRFGVVWQATVVLDWHNLAKNLACVATCGPDKNDGRNCKGIVTIERVVK